MCSGLFAFVRLRLNGITDTKVPRIKFGDCSGEKGSEEENPQRIYGSGRQIAEDTFKS
jgi:hypothetical protein